MSNRGVGVLGGTPTQVGPELPTVRLGRQAIYDSSLHSWAYELFYRGGSGREPRAPDADRATCSVVLSAFAELGLHRVASNKRVFLNVAHDVISGALPLPVPTDIAVLSVRDYEHSATELLSALRQRKAEGYQIALDGYLFRPETEPLLEVADYLKFNVSQLGLARLAEQVERVRGRALTPIACRIETPAQFNACVAAGCRSFQGSFLFRPQLLSHKRLPTSLKTVMLLLRRLRDPSVELREVEAIVKTDPALGVTLLRLLGCAAYSLPHAVSSVSQAVSLLGIREFTKWITVVALTSGSERPSELSLVALIRARASELIATAVGADPNSAFMVGLMSAVEALFERPLRSVLEELPISDEIRGAVLDRAGVLGAILAEVLGREGEEGPPSSRFATGTVNRAWLEALSWATNAQERAAMGTGSRSPIVAPV